MSTNSIDEHVGMRLKLKRSALGITQSELGDIAGVTFQQIQKYEKGANRIGAGRLYKFSTILNVPISYFFDGLEEGDMKKTLSDSKSEIEFEYESFDVPEKELSILLKFFTRIKDRKIRNSVIDLARSLSKKE